jgi:hypothetical protein
VNSAYNIQRSELSAGKISACHADCDKKKKIVSTVGRNKSLLLMTSLL